MGLYLWYDEGEKAISQIGRDIPQRLFDWFLPFMVFFIFIRNIISILVFNSSLFLKDPDFLGEKEAGSNRILEFRVKNEKVTPKC